MTAAWPEGTALVPRAIRRFRDKHPDIRVTLHVLLSRDVRDLIAEGRFDETIYATTLCALVAEGVGVGLANPYVARELGGDALVLRPFKPAVEIRSLLLLPPDRQKSVLVRDFISALMASR